MGRSFIVSAFAWIAFAGASWAQGGDRQELCGFTFPVQSYRAEVVGLHIELTANDRLLVNGRVISEHGSREGQVPQPWGDSANAAQIAVTRDYILVQTLRTDCVDYAWGRIYVIGRDGRLRATSELWSMHDAWAGFSEEGPGLMYSSEWLCGEYSGASPGRAHVYVLRDGMREFQREERASSEVCRPVANRVMPQNRIYFAPMQPVSP